MGHGEQQQLQKIPDTEITVERKDQWREDVHYRTGVTRNAQKTKKSVVGSPIEAPIRKRKEEI